MVKNKMCPLELLRITHVGNSNFNKKKLKGLGGQQFNDHIYLQF